MYIFACIVLACVAVIGVALAVTFTMVAFYIVRRLWDDLLH